MHTPAIEQSSQDFANEIVVFGLRDSHPPLVAWRHAGFERDIDVSVDLRRIPWRARDDLLGLIVDLIDEDFGFAANLVTQELGADPLLGLHEAVPALFLEFLGHMSVNLIGLGASHGFIFEAAHTLEPCCLKPVEKNLEILLSLAWKADDERRAYGEVRTGAPPVRQSRQHLFLMGGP